jgi:hypothetical protein
MRHSESGVPGFVLLAAVAALAFGAPAAHAADTKASPRVTPRTGLVKARTQVPEIPADIKALGDHLWNAASPAVKSWASQNAVGIAKGTGDPEALSRSAVQSRWSHVRASGASDTLTFLVNYQALKAVQDDLKSRLDSMNEMSEMTSMRLQMAMDRRSKFVSALSNIMKKISSTQETLVQNLK